MQYLLFLFPVYLFALSYKNKVKYHQLKNSGNDMCEVMSAGQYKTLFLMLGVMVFLMCIFLIMISNTGSVKS